MKAWLLVAAMVTALPAPLHAQTNSSTSSWLSRIDTSKPAQAFKLDPTLAEISGLAPASATTVFAHNDEYAIVHELDITNGIITRAFALGKPTIAGDFEGIAVSGQNVYLITSDGLLYEAPIKKHRERARYTTYDTGLKEFCEIEGMAIDQDADAFLFLCKNSVRDKKNKRITIYRWTVAERFQDHKPWLEIAIADVVPENGKRENLKASELQRDPKTGHLFILDANAGAVVEITQQGAPVAYRPLAPRAHSQAEGLALMPGGAIVVGDESRGAADGRLTVYRAGN